MKQEKRRNVVIHNLKEPNADQYLEEKQAQDKQEFQEMCKKKTMKLNARVNNTYRIGKAGARPRLLVIVMEEETTKWEVLKMAKQLRDVE